MTTSLRQVIAMFRRPPKKMVATCRSNVFRPFEISIRHFGTIDHKNMSPVDVEKELFRMKRLMGTHYSNGSYGEALNVARDLELEIKEIMGSDNAVHASCINNIGLMLKMLGKLQPAMEHYERSLAMYEAAVGTHHMSYYSTLANIGVLCKTMSEGTSDPIQYESLMERAESSLTTALAGQKELIGSNSKEILVNENHLANVMKRLGKMDEAEEKLTDTLEACRELDQDSVTALTLNNMGVLLKEMGKLEEAEEAYTEALALRTEIGGERHHDSILVMHNMAELYQAQGDEDKANEIRQKILKVMDVNPEPEKWSDVDVYESLPNSVRGEVAIEDKRPVYDPKIHGGRG